MAWGGIKRVLSNLVRPSNRRTYDRLSVDSHVQLSCGDVLVSCRIADVSAGGAFLVPDPDLPIGTEGVLRLPGAPVAAAVRIVRRTDSGVGIEFLRDGVGAIVAGWVRAVSGTGPAAQDDAAHPRI
ncbi:PilZ domain-containing protein [Nitrospirillum sp. BR 11163]|uniref:PilZ domain-containing protein n=1 Tax=Nitrospirillum sp. BR 11163 TaxID=3104323 RepID=UPI002B000E77|nr:PilZ domain-containing protein [Nitrospirillum sp. BR 11163]MEA1675152.1 PilZ domain-containing protein [Nitrospirillum sp. BR 11163]